MTRRQVTLGATAFVLVVGGVLIGYVLATGQSEPSPSSSPSVAPSAALACEVSVTPDTILVDPDTGASEDVLFFAGTGFLPNRAVSIFLTGSVVDVTTTGEGGFTTEVTAASGTAYPEPPGIEPGPVTWNVTGWDAAEPPAASASTPPRACQTQVTVTIQLTHQPSATPNLEMSAGSYAEVVADGVRVRVQPSLDATPVGALYNGDVVRIIEPAFVAEGLAWYRVESVVTQSGESVSGYMAAGSGDQVYLVPTTAPPPPTPTPSPSPSPTASS